jgi:hypothetical protein
MEMDSQDASPVITLSTFYHWPLRLARPANTPHLLPFSFALALGFGFALALALAPALPFTLRVIPLGILFRSSERIRFGLGLRLRLRRLGPGNESVSILRLDGAL